MMDDPADNAARAGAHPEAPASLVTLEKGSRLADACAMLDPAEEARLAEEGMQSDADAWPDY
jgi:hypothetical protein